MANNWNNKYAIWQDLSIAQGREVPAEIDNTVGEDERPPRLTIEEETEENFFENCVGGGDYNAGPDLKLIQQMLKEVGHPDDDDKPEASNNIIRNKTTKNRNVAVASLLEIYGGAGEANTSSNFLKPEESDKESVSPALWLPNTANMFKKKNPSPRSSENSPTPAKSNALSENDRNTLEQPRMFVPSSRASEYYNKYIQQRKVQPAVAREDIWTRAERQMKEIDAKRKQESVSPSLFVPNSTSSETKGLDLVRLSQHRHQINDDCVVCEVLCRKKFDKTQSK